MFVYKISDFIFIEQLQHTKNTLQDKIFFVYILDNDIVTCFCSGEINYTK